MIHIMYYSQKITNFLLLFSTAQSPMSSFYSFFLSLQMTTSAPLVADLFQLSVWLTVLSLLFLFLSHQSQYLYRQQYFVITSYYIYSNTIVLTYSKSIVNPGRACAARVIVVGLSVCLSVTASPPFSNGYSA